MKHTMASNAQDNPSNVDAQLQSAGDSALKVEKVALNDKLDKVEATLLDQKSGHASISGGFTPTNDNPVSGLVSGLVGKVAASLIPGNKNSSLLS